MSKPLPLLGKRISKVLKSKGRATRRIVSYSLITVLLVLTCPPATQASIVRKAGKATTNIASQAKEKIAAWVKRRQPSKAPQTTAQGMPPLPNTAPGVRPAPPSSRVQLESRVASLRINTSPQVTLRTEETFRFSAVALSSSGDSIHGIRADWRTSNVQVVRIDRRGNAVGGNPGQATVTASLAGIQRSVQVTVIEGSGEPFGGKKRVNSRRVNGRVIQGEEPQSVYISNSSHRSHHAGSRKIHARTVPSAGMLLPDVTFDPLPDDETGSIYLPGNNTGSPPGTTVPGGSTPPVATNGTENGNKNFSFTLPIVHLPGRGIDASVGLVYNSLLWNKSVDPGTLQTWLTYDVDSGYPAPGFRLGFGQIEDQGTAGFTLTEASGIRRSLSLVTTNNYKTTDGSFIRYVGGAGSGTLFYPGGTQVVYGAAGTGIRIYPTKITDRNGNFIEVSYKDGVGPRIDTITDTLERDITFHYDSNGDLVTIKAPGLNGTDRQVIRFYYENISLSVSLFSGINVGLPASGNARVIRYIYLPSSVESGNAHIGYRYDYSPFGMIREINQFRGMTISSDSLTSTGSNPSEGTNTVSATTTYNYPTSASPALTDVPKYSTRCDDWAGRTTGMDGNPSNKPCYAFAVNEVTGESTVEAPDHTVTLTETTVNPGNWDHGLIEEITVQHGSAPTELTKTTIDWDPGVTNGSFRISQVRSTDVPANLTKAVVYSYDDTNGPYNNVSVVSERAFTTDGSVSTSELRRTETTYVTSSSYINRDLFSLPSMVKVFPGGSSTPGYRIDYAYDNYGSGHANLTTRSGIDTHDPTFNYAHGSYNSATDYRGNVTSVTSYPDATTSTGSLVDDTTYDITGNVTTAELNCCQIASYSYSSSHHFAYVTSVTKGNPSGLHLTTEATYDASTGLLATTTDENDQETSYSYHTDSLRLDRVDYSNGGFTDYHYSDQLYANTAGKMHYFMNVSTKLDATRTFDSYTFFDGRGAVAETFDNYTSQGWSTQDIQYDEMGRAYRVSNPYYCGGYAWVSVNPDGFWTTKTFDRLNRVTQVTMPRGDNNNSLTTSVQIAYAGEFVTTTDQANKQRRQKSDALGRVIRLDEPTTSGLGMTASPNQATVYEYDVLDNLTRIDQGDQDRFFKYDSMSRLIREKQVEQLVNSAYNISPPPAGNNSWTKQILYNSSGLVSEVDDARGLRTQFTYDDLNRLQKVEYKNWNGTAHTTPSAHYYYDSQTLPTGAPIYTPGFSNGRLLAVTYGGPTATAGTYFGYDNIGQVVTQKQVTGNKTFSMSYSYNLAGLVTSQTYPSNRKITYGYDDAGRLSSVSDPSTTFASGLTYEPQGALKSETWGNGAVHSVAYNRRLQPTEIKLKQTAAGSELQRYDYSYGDVTPATGAIDSSKNNGQIGRIAGFINGAIQWDQRFEYDEVGRLKKASEFQGGTGSTPTWKLTYTYDQYGNRRQAVGADNAGVSFTPVVPSDYVNTTNRFISTGSTPVSYDAAGNITNDQKFRFLSYTYDANSRQTSASGGGVTQNSVYDVFGLRVQTSTNSTRRMVYDIFGNLIADYKGDVLERENIYRGGQLLTTQEFTPMTPTARNVIWTSVSGTIQVTGNSIQKTSGTSSWYDAGAVSSQEITAGDGYVEFSTAETNWSKMCGLGNNSSASNYYGDIEYALYAAPGAALQIYESGTLRGTFGTYTTSDRLKVAVENGVVKYYKNSTLLYTSTMAPSYPLQVDTSLNTVNTSLSNVVIANNVQNVSWTSVSGTLQATGNSIQKTSGAGSWTDAGAVSSQMITSGEGYVEFTPGNTTTARMCGLGNTNSSVNYTDIEYAFYPAVGASLLIYESGISRGPFGTYAATDRLKVAVESGAVKYYKNGNLVYTSTVAPTYPLQVDTSFYTLGAHISDVTLSNAVTQGSVNYVLQDAQGSSRAMTNNVSGSSTIVARHDYLPFGEEIPNNTGLRSSGQGYAAADKNRIKYGLTERDNNGLDHTWWRKHDSTAGRWTSPDPYLGSMNIAAPQSYNRYLYVMNDPVNSIDPMGLFGPPPQPWIIIPPPRFGGDVLPEDPNSEPPTAVGPPQNPTQQQPCDPYFFGETDSFNIGGRSFTGGDLNIAARVVYAESSSGFSRVNNGPVGSQVFDERNAIASVLYNLLSPTLPTFNSVANSGRLQSVTSPRHNQKFLGSSISNGAYQNLLERTPQGTGGDCNDLRGSVDAIRRMINNNGPFYRFDRFRGGTTPVGNSTVIGGSRFGYAGVTNTGLGPW